MYVCRLMALTFSTSPGRGPNPRRFRTWTIVLSSLGKEAAAGEEVRGSTLVAISANPVATAVVKKRDVIPGLDPHLAPRFKKSPTSFLAVFAISAYQIQRAATSLQSCNPALSPNPHP